MSMDFIGLSVGMGYTDETAIGGGALKGKNCVVSNIEEVANGVNVTFQWTLDNGTVQTETVLLPKGTQGEAGVDGKSAYEIWLEAGNTGTEQDFLISLVGEKGADGTMTFADLTEEQKEYLKGEDGFSPIITENADNTDDVYKLDIETKDGILTTPNLKGQGGEVAGSTYLATGSIDMENETVTFDQTFEEIKTAYLEGKAILAEMLVEGEAKYIFNPLYVLGDAIAFEWINSSAKLGVQINLMEDNSTALSVTSLEGSEGSEALDTLVITGNYSTDDDDNWTVSNIDKTFVEINEAITINRDVVLRLYPEGDTTNPYILYPAMHYANMGTAFSLMVSDTGQISGLSVMITADNQVMASRNSYEFGKVTRIKTIEIPIDRIHKDYSGNTSTKVGLTKINDCVKRLSFCIEESVFTENNIDVSKLFNIYLTASGQQGGALMTTNPYGTSDIFHPGRSGNNGTDGVRYVQFNLNVFELNGNSGDSSTEFTVTSCKIRYEE